MGCLVYVALFAIGAIGGPVGVGIVLFVVCPILWLCGVGRND